MATTRQLTALFQAIAHGNLEEAAEVAAVIAEHAEKTGHRRTAETLRGSLNPNGKSNVVDDRSETRRTSTLGLLIREHLDVNLGDVRLTPDAQRELADLVLEYRFRSKLSEEGVSRRRTVLFLGPPGCGKSMTARALGQELNLPVYAARLSAVVGSYLGQTGAHLHELFRWAEQTPCILLLDEIDSLGQSRGRMEDVGELDRVVISLLQELDHSKPAGITIAATNRPESLDEALLRRFEFRLEFPTPDDDELRSFARARSKDYGLKLRRDERDGFAGARTYADIEAVLQAIRRRRVLDELRG